MDISAEEEIHEQDQDQDQAPVSANSVPSLGHFCVRAIGANFNSIDSLGTMPYRIVKPILEDKRCTPDILRKFELNSPHLKKLDQEIWQKFCFDKYPEKVESYSRGELSVNSWRKLYTQSQLEDEEKLQQAAIRLREFKELASAEKKGRQVQITTKLPPAKRTKWGDSSWGSGPSKPKSLIEKARVQSKKTSTMYRGSGASMARVGGGIGGGGSSSSSSTTSSTSGSRSPQVARSSSLFIPKPKPKPTAPISSPSAPTRVSPNKAHNILLQDHLALASGESSSSSSTASSSPGALRALGSSNVGNGHGGGDQHINHPTLQRFTAVSTTNADPTRPLSSSFPSASSARISISSLSSSKKQPYFNVGKPSLSWPH